MKTKPTITLGVRLLHIRLQELLILLVLTLQTELLHGFLPLKHDLVHVPTSSICCLLTPLQRKNRAQGIGSLRDLSMQNNNIEVDEGGEKSKSELSTKSLLESLTYFSNDSPKAYAFSGLMALSGAILGPFLDSYHSLFGVLVYNTPLTLQLWGSPNDPVLVTTYWVPPLFGLAGVLIGWLYIWLDRIFLEDTKNASVEIDNRDERREPDVPKILFGISVFTFQYWLSGVLYTNGVDRTIIMGVMSVLAAAGFKALDGTVSGAITSLATAIGGPLIEVGLISLLPLWGDGTSAYHYADGGETGFFPLWIIPVYFLGGPANGNLARGIWNALPAADSKATIENLSVVCEKTGPSCQYCFESRAVPCPNCDNGTYVTYGQQVVCNCCRGKGLVICRNCFSNYDDDPGDIENIRKIMDCMPD